MIAYLYSRNPWLCPSGSGYVLSCTAILSSPPFQWWLHQLRYTDVLIVKYNRITSTNAPSFCTTTFRTRLTNLTALLPQSRDCGCYVSRRILTPPQLWPQNHTDLRPHDFVNCPDLWYHPRHANVPCASRWRLRAITPVILRRIRAPFTDCLHIVTNIQNMNAYFSTPKDS
jgi:hypothetical protein